MFSSSSLFLAESLRVPEDSGTEARWRYPSDEEALVARGRERSQTMRWPLALVPVLECGRTRTEEGTHGEKKLRAGKEQTRKSDDEKERKKEEFQRATPPSSSVPV